ncbi:DUF2586 domain-containing protein [uncultured Dokdonia sp.]|uniref:DUF2586 domain-containing protein n=1 Tax=uncultured Dokdonia sp. TaxID=575653 RepID=UPI00261AC163|nr:DUF2586 domain-containing protein [uncultured Dokdonia sp.]
MSVLKDIVVEDASDILSNRNPNHDMISGLLFNGSITPEGLKYHTIFRLASSEDAEKLGITEAYDSHEQSAYYQIKQYFRLNPVGDLYIMVTDETSFEGVARNAKKMQELARGEIRQMALIFSGEATFDDTKCAIQEAQLQADKAYADHMPFEVLIEGKGFAEVYSKGVLELDDLADCNASNVSVVIAMDADATLIYSNTAAVGMALGAVSYAKVSENIVWAEQFNLLGKGFLNPGFIGGAEITSKEELEVLNQRRYVFARKHIGLPGLYFNDSHTATSGISDVAYIENNRTIHKAVRLVHKALLPKLNASILVNTKGILALSIIKGLEGLCRKALRHMVSSREISTFDIFIDPSQHILANSKLQLKVEITPIGTARKIVVDVNFKNPFRLKELELVTNKMLQS